MHEDLLAHALMQERLAELERRRLIREAERALFGKATRRPLARRIFPRRTTAPRGASPPEKRAA
jgi:hypothetical protein